MHMDKVGWQSVDIKIYSDIKKNSLTWYINEPIKRIYNLLKSISFNVPCSLNSQWIIYDCTVPIDFLFLVETGDT